MDTHISEGSQIIRFHDSINLNAFTVYGVWTFYLEKEKGNEETS